MKKYIPSIIIFGCLFYLVFLGLKEDELFEPKARLSEPYASIAKKDIPKLQKELFDEAKAISIKREKMTNVMLELPYFEKNTPPEAIDNFFISRGTTEEEFLEYYEMTERQLYKK